MRDITFYHWSLLKYEFWSLRHYRSWKMSSTNSISLQENRACAYRSRYKCLTNQITWSNNALESIDLRPFENVHISLCAGVRTHYNNPSQTQNSIFKSNFEGDWVCQLHYASTDEQSSVCFRCVAIKNAISSKWDTRRCHLFHCF